MNDICNSPITYQDETFLDDLCFSLWLRNDDCEIAIRENNNVNVFNRWTYEEASDEWYVIKWLQCKSFDIDIQYDDEWIPYVATLTRKHQSQ